MNRTRLTTLTRGIDRLHPAMKLFEKAKRLGTWNPSEIDLTEDRRDWLKLTPDEQLILLHLTALFQAGEEAVTLDLLPLVMAIAQEGRLEEELYLTTFLFEEAKHTDFFNRFIGEVAAGEGDLEAFTGPQYRSIFYEALPESLDTLRTDPSPSAQVRASATYNMIVEGVLAETGYHAYFEILESRGIMPGTREGVRLVKRDESRHIAYGVFLLSRLIAADDARWDELENRMNELLMPALGVITEIFAQYEPVPFDLQESDFILFASNQFSKRIDRIEKARRCTLEQILADTHLAIDHETS